MRYEVIQECVKIGNISILADIEIEILENTKHILSLVLRYDKWGNETLDISDILSNPEVYDYIESIVDKNWRLKK